MPPHAGMRQYWRDFEALERWARSLPHKEWWGRFLRDSAGTGIWHETYFLRGGIEAIYGDVPAPLGLLAFAPQHPRPGPCSPSPTSAGLGGNELAPVIPEAELERRLRSDEHQRSRSRRLPAIAVDFAGGGSP